MVLNNPVWFCRMCIVDAKKIEHKCAKLVLDSHAIPVAKINHTLSFNDLTLRFEKSDQEAMCTWISDRYRGALEFKSRGGVVFSF
jgi:hypothetical protein